VRADRSAERTPLAVATGQTLQHVRTLCFTQPRDEARCGGRREVSRQLPTDIIVPKIILALVLTSILVIVPLAPVLAAKPGGGGSGGNQAPIVAITAPVAGAQIQAGSNLQITASANDADGAVSNVEFFRNGIRIARDTRAPFAVTWSNVPAGTYTLTAIATDNARSATTSSAISITVAAPGCSTLPGVPSGLASPTQSEHSIGLQWTASATGTHCSVTYRVLRNGVEVALTQNPAYTDGGLEPGTSYSYRVVASNAFGSSAPSATLSVSTAVPGPISARRSVGYFTQWGIYTHGVTARSLDARGSAAQLTHLIYAFGNVRNNRCELGVLAPTDPATGVGGDAYADYARTYAANESVDGVADIWGQPLRGHWNQLRKLKAKYPQLKVLISLGGWNWSRGFASAARTENRQAFVASCVDAYIRGNLPAFDAAGGSGAASGVFDGIDIDWEYPAACGLSCGGDEDRTNFTALLAEFRRQLDAVRPDLLLSVAIGAGIDKIRVTDPGLYQAHVDQINVMSYDFHGSWETRTNFHSALFASPDDPASGDAARYNTDDAVQALLDRGVPATKINLGIASYGRGWRNVSSANNGLYQTGTAASGSLGAGVESYRVLKALNHPAFVDPHSLSRWTFANGTFWSYDTPASIADKIAYAQVRGLGGAFLWDFTGDDDAGSLVRAIHTGQP
jgi:chitinase